MENQKLNQNETKKENQKLKPEDLNKPIFKKRYEMKGEDLLKLPHFKVIFTENKNGGASFKILLNDNIKLNADYPRQTLTETQFELAKRLSLLKQKPSGSFTEEKPVRFLEGLGKTGKIYHSWELFVCRNVSFQGLFSDAELDLIQMEIEDGNLPCIDWVKSTVIIDDEKETVGINNYSDIFG